MLRFWGALFFLASSSFECYARTLILSRNHSPRHGALCHRTMESYSVVIGSTGVTLLLLAYALNLLWPKAMPLWVNSVLNLLGALLAGYASYLIHYLPFVILELAWTAVALVSLVFAIRKRP